MTTGQPKACASRIGSPNPSRKGTYAVTAAPASAQFLATGFYPGEVFAAGQAVQERAAAGGPAAESVAGILRRIEELDPADGLDFAERTVRAVAGELRKATRR